MSYLHEALWVIAGLLAVIAYLLFRVKVHLEAQVPLIHYLEGQYNELRKIRQASEKQAERRHLENAVLEIRDSVERLNNTLGGLAEPIASIEGSMNDTLTSVNEIKDTLDDR